MYCLHYAILIKDPNTLECLLEHAEDKDVRTSVGTHPLILAVDSGWLEGVKLMIKYGIDINTKDGTGRTPLQIAHTDNNTQMVEILIGLGADTNSKDKYGMISVNYKRRW